MAGMVGTAVDTMLTLIVAVIVFDAVIGICFCSNGCNNGATTYSIMTFSINELLVTLNIKDIQP